jgi:3-isopropylmalate/(R)-2-methylmalate dehydratase small subunit
MSAFAPVRSHTVVFAADNVDTDQIIPARFLVATERGAWGDKLFADRRYDASGAPRPEFPLNDERARDAGILVAGRNFGCGSSREHAAWALRDFGFRAVLAPSFADIFRGNALKNGLVPVVVPQALHAQLCAAPGTVVTVDVAALTVTPEGGAPTAFTLDVFSRYCLLNGVDELGYLQQNQQRIADYEKARTLFEEASFS